MLHSCSTFCSYHLCYNWTKHITSTLSYSMCLRTERNKKNFGSTGVFPPIEPMHLISTFSLWARHTSRKVWRSQLIPQISISESSEPVKPKSKPKTKTGLAEEGGTTIRGATSRILIFRENRGTWSMNFTRRSPVRRTYNTEPSPKELVWGRSTPVYPGKYSFPLFVLVLISFNLLKMMNEKQNKKLSLH